MQGQLIYKNQYVQDTLFVNLEELFSSCLSDTLIRELLFLTSQKKWNILNLIILNMAEILQLEMMDNILCPNSREFEHSWSFLGIAHLEQVIT